MLVQLPQVSVPNVLDGATTPEVVLPQSSKEKGERDSKARVHNQKGDLKDLQSRDPIVLAKDSKMAKWDLGDQKGDPKDLLFVSNVENQVIRQSIVELGLMKLQSNLSLQWVGYG